MKDTQEKSRAEGASSQLAHEEESSGAHDSFREDHNNLQPVDSQHTQSVIVDDDDHDSFYAPPAYGDSVGNVQLHQDGIQTDARVTYDGRIDIKIDTANRKLVKLLAPILSGQLDHEHDLPPPFSPLSGLADDIPIPEMNIVIQLVGSRGDIQPFMSLGLVLKSFGHRVRIATHQVFRGFIEGLGLEFFSIGGDPMELMAFMVKNPGLIPSFNNVLKGEVQRKRAIIKTIMEGCWRSCVEASDKSSPGSGIFKGNLSKDPIPFVADAIIANPPSFAHLHCAEKLGIPLHMVFTMPWSPTQAFAHPLANVQSSNADTGLTNYISYILVEMLTWQGVGSIINSFRRKTLGLEPIASTWAPGIVHRLKVPHTYCWSPSLISKPKDWGSHISVPGFCFLSLGSIYTPPPELVSFLEKGPQPIYIGFGSIVVEDPSSLTAIIFEAIELAGVRAVVSQGWGDLGATAELPENIFLLGDCPHDWLFKQVSCVVHHGGSGTTSAGIAASKPTVVVPFFGDQPFWGNMVSRAGAGPQPIPFRQITAEGLASAIKFALQPSIMEKAAALAESINEENGSEAAAKSFHDRLPLAVMGCSLMPKKPAVWRVPNSEMRLSALAATVLRKECLLDFRSLKLYRSCEYDTSHGPWEPVSGGLLAITDLFYDTFKGFGEIGTDFVRMPTTGRARNKTQSDNHSISSLDPSIFNISKTESKTFGSGSAKGMGRIFKAAVRSPGAFSLALAQGAHNAPKMWGDKTVRPQENITGLGSGLLAGIKELGLGTYDGIAGLFVQPVIGARDGGALGLVKGLGKGLVGTPVKFFAAMSGIVGYPLKGLDMEITKALNGRKEINVISERVAQGEREYVGISIQERHDVTGRWQAILATEKLDRKGKKKANFGT